MVARAKMPCMSREAYLERERSAETKSEYFDGVVSAIAWPSPEHDRVTGKIYAGLHAPLRGSDCEPFTSDMRVHLPACNRYYYPDTSVACGGSRFESLSGVRSAEAHETIAPPDAR